MGCSVFQLLFISRLHAHNNHGGHGDVISTWVCIANFPFYSLFSAVDGDGYDLHDDVTMGSIDRSHLENESHEGGAHTGPNEHPHQSAEVPSPNGTNGASDFVESELVETILNPDHPQSGQNLGLKRSTTQIETEEVGLIYI